MLHLSWRRAAQMFDFLPTSATEVGNASNLKWKKNWVCGTIVDGNAIIKCATVSPQWLATFGLIRRVFIRVSPVLTVASVSPSCTMRNNLSDLQKPVDLIFAAELYHPHPLRTQTCASALSAVPGPSQRSCRNEAPPDAFENLCAESF